MASQVLSDTQTQKLEQVIEQIPQILAETDDPTYDEIYGYRIGPDGLEHVQANIRNEILLKFLIASEWDVATAHKKLVATLNWRKQFQVLHAAYAEDHDPDLAKLGVVAEYKNNKDNFRVVTWNLYANLKNPKKLFADFGQDKTTALPGTLFLRWRIGLMERALSLLSFSDADNCKVAQVHDYNNVSMFRMDPGMKAATKEIIALFGDNYPELLSKKYFINVPVLMGWIFTFFKATCVIGAATVKKFEMRHWGDLSDAFGKDNLPLAYNGGHANDAVPDIFTLATATETPAYAKVVLDRLKNEALVTKAPEAAPKTDAPAVSTAGTAPTTTDVPATTTEAPATTTDLPPTNTEAIKVAEVSHGGLLSQVTDAPAAPEDRPEVATKTA